MAKTSGDGKNDTSKGFSSQESKAWRWRDSEPRRTQVQGKAEREVFPLSNHGLGYFDGPTSFSYGTHLSVLGIPFWSLFNSQFTESGCFGYIFHFWKPLLTNVSLRPVTLSRVRESLNKGPRIIFRLFEDILQS